MKRNRTLLASLALAAALLLSACAAIQASNEPKRNGLIDQVQRGMSREQVVAILGPPDETMPFPLSKTVAWDYRYTDTWGYLASFGVTFGSDWRVVSTISRRLNDGRSESGRQ